MIEYNGLACVTQAQLLEYMTKRHIDVLVHRQQIKRVVRGCRNTPALYSVESLPHKIQAEVYKRYPKPEETSRGSDFYESVGVSPEAACYYYEYRLPDGQCLSEERQRLYTNTASILDAVTRWRDEGSALRRRVGRGAVSLESVLRILARELPLISRQYPNTLKGSVRSLRRRYSDYIAKGYESIIHQGYGNTNRRALDSTEQEQALMAILSHANNLDNAQVASYYNDLAKANGWKSISSRTVGNWRERWVLEMEAGRKGKKSLRNTLAMQTKRSRPTAPLLMWTLDGWDVELFYQSSRIDKRGHRITTYANRLVMVVVLDPHGDYPIGYAIGDSESAALIKEAIRNALTHTRELWGEMYHPHQVQSDNFGRGTLEALYQGVSHHYTPAQVGNAKSKVIEPYFAYLNKTYCQHCNNWSGFGVKAKRQVNDERLNLIKKHFPTREELVEIIHEMMRRERALKVEGYKESWSRLDSDRKIAMSRERYLGLFGEVTGQRNTLSSSGLHPTILGMRRDYDCFDVRFREYAHVRWEVRYDPNDLSQVLAVSEDGRQRFLLEQKHVQPMALVDRTDGDAEALQRVLNYNAALEARIDERLSQARETAGRLALPQHNILSKLLLTDSNGQHKTRRKAIEQSIEDAEYEDMQEIGPEAQITTPTTSRYNKY